VGNETETQQCALCGLTRVTRRGRKYGPKRWYRFYGGANAAPPCTGQLDVGATPVDVARNRG